MRRLRTTDNVVRNAPRRQCIAAEDRLRIVVATASSFRPHRCRPAAASSWCSSTKPGPLEFENDEMHIEKANAGARSFIVLPKLKPGQYDFITGSTQCQRADRHRKMTARTATLVFHPRRKPRPPASATGWRRTAA
jgi:hypothetical protein